MLTNAQHSVSPLFPYDYTPQPDVVVQGAEVVRLHSEYGCSLSWIGDSSRKSWLVLFMRLLVKTTFLLKSTLPIQDNFHTHRIVREQTENELRN